MITKAINKLEKKDRAVVVRRYFEDMKLEEIAEVLQENLSTVKSRLYRSMKKLRLEMEEQMAADENVYRAVEFLVPQEVIGDIRK